MRNITQCGTKSVRMVDLMVAEMASTSGMSPSLPEHMGEMRGHYPQGA